MENIKYLIFDLGNVLYDIDIQRSVQEFKRLGVNDFYNLYSLESQTKLFDNLEKGFISEQEFCNIIIDTFKIPASKDEIIHAWNSLLIGFNDEVVPSLELAKKHFQIGLLSNTNAIHIEKINLEAKLLFNVRSFYELFQGYFLSFQMNQRKPDSEIYISVEKELKASPSEIFFIDDNEANIKQAFDLGWYVHLKKKNESLLDVVKGICGI